MKLLRRQFLLLTAAMIATPTSSRGALETYPARPVRVIVPYAPAGPADILARLTAQKLSESLGKQFYVENVGGAGGNIGMGRRQSRTRWLHDPGRSAKHRRQAGHVRNCAIRPLQGF